MLFLVGSLLFLGGFMKSCSFFGHRDTPQTDELKQKIRETVERLITEDGIDTFLFGSRSQFDELCHIVVTELKEKYPNISRIAYLCKHESGCLMGTGMELKRKIKGIAGRDTYVAEYEEIKKSDRVDSAGCASYVERNQWMIDESDCLILYYNEGIGLKSSGTKLAMEYAKRKKSLAIFNL